MSADPGTLGKVLSLLSPRERKTGLVVLVMMLVLALLETAGVASVMPFLAVLGSPELVETQPALVWAYERGAFESVDQFLFVLGVGAFVMVLFSAGFRIATTYAINRWTQMRRYSIGERLLATYLRQPYEFFLNRNSADLSKSILSEVDELERSVYKPLMNLVAYSLVAIVLVAFLLWLDPVLAVLVAIVVGGAYGLIYVGIRGILGRLGVDRVNVNRERFTAASEALGGIKDLKVLGREEAYLSRFRGPASRFARYQAISMTLSAAPKYLIEAVGFGGVLLLALILLGTDGNLGTVLPVLGVYTFAGYRLLPSAQHIFAGLSKLRFGLPAVHETWQDLKLRSGTNVGQMSNSRLLLREAIRFEGVSFRYPDSETEALRGIDLEIKAGTAVGFVGKTGAGKSTAVDLLLGLLTPTDGRITIDHQPLSPTCLRAWQNNAGYVPQTTYLADASLAENIAFGVPRNAIDLKAVIRAAKLAEIHNFIVGRCPLGYETQVGERGVRLSGGQRQRLGIARALYHDPDVLVLDEATSALDADTESVIMRAVAALPDTHTVVMISHRKESLRFCDEVVVFEKGKVGISSFGSSPS
jgi:ATP-binding cassette, subfamily B, bacterial PglK